MKHRVLAATVVIAIILSVLPVFVSPGNVCAASATLIPSKDTYIRSGTQDDTNYGAATSIKVGSLRVGVPPAPSGGESERGLVEFIEPWGSIIPAGSTITSAFLQLYYYDYFGTANPMGRVIYAQRILRVGADQWSHSQATWNKYHYYGFWNTPGAAGLGTDYTTSGQAAAMVPASGNWMTWVVTDQVQWSLDNNEDISFRLYDPSDGGCGASGVYCYEMSFYSYEYAPTYGPRLIINYVGPQKPTVGTIGADNVTYEAASLYGDIIGEGSADVTVRGFKYGLTQSDTWDEHETGSFAVGDYSLNVTGLIADSTYYFRAYATNIYGTSYGSWQSFATSTGVPVVTTDSVYVYGFCTGINAIMSGTITSEGDSNVTIRGFKYGTDPYTATGDIHEAGSFDVGSYNLTEFMSANTTYWFRAYATNGEGTGYGIWKPFYSPGVTPSDCSAGGGANVTGAGTLGDPYVIWTDYGLQEMQLHLSSYWELGCNIDATNTSTWNAGAGFAPVGTFTGHFNGNNYSITGLYIDRAATNDVGLFSVATGATVGNVSLIGVNMTGKDYVGGLVARATSTTSISYCIVTGEIVAERYAGGLVARSQSAGVTIYRCMTNVDVYAPYYVGGFVYWAEYGTISECASYGTASAWDRVGGFVWSGGYATIHDCYSHADVIIMGVIGKPQLNGGFKGTGGTTVDNCYSKGLVDCQDGDGCSSTGGFAGQSGCTDSFWDTQTSGYLWSSCGTGKTTSEMTVADTFTAAGWNFTGIWDIDPLINDGYPYFGWELTIPPEDGTEYTLTLSSTTGGNVTTPGEGSFDYPYGQVVNLVATPDEGYRFALWVGDVTEVADTHSAATTVTMTNDFSIMAVFVAEGKLALYLTSTAGGNVTDPGEGLFSYNASDVVDLEATANVTYAFVQWTGDVEDVGDIYNSTTTVTMLDDYAIRANFISSGNYALIITSTDGGDCIIPGEGLFEYAPSTVVDLVAQPNPGAWFNWWSGNVSTIADYLFSSTNITMSGNYSIVANFFVPGTYNLTVSSSVGGNVTDPGEGTFTYDFGTVVDLAALPDDGYDFFTWTGDTDTIDDLTAAFTTIRMVTNCNITANFEPGDMCSLSLNVTPVEGGNITTPGIGAFTYPCGTTVGITAQAYDGWWFRWWAGTEQDIATIANILSFNTTIDMLDDYEVTATFVKEEEPLEGAPTVVTHNATSIAATSAWLNGELTSLGNYTQGDVFFSYGLDTSYGTNTPVQLLAATGNFTRWVGNLASNTTYHFRAVCQYADGYVYGEDKEFTTTVAAPPSECLWEGIHAYESHLVGDDDVALVYGSTWYGQTFTVDPESHSVVDVRFKAYRVGEPSTVTVSIRVCGNDGLPVGEDLTSGTMNGDVVTNSTAGDWYGVALTEVSLSYGELYAICIRAEIGDAENYLALLVDTDNGYAGGSGIGPGAESGGVIWVLDSDNDIMFQVDGQALIRIMDARVFTDYLETDDMLVVLAYLNTYVPYYPTQITSLHFWLQLRTPNGDAVMAQTVCQQWGYMPGAIYLNANQAASLTLGMPYRVYLYGTSAEHPIACYGLATTDWLGDALDLLPPWVIATAHAMADYYGVAMTTQLNNNEVLNSEGGVLFATGIPSLLLTNPELFSDVVYTPDYDPITPGPTSFDTATTWQTQVGPVITDLANMIAGVVNLEGKHAINALLFIFYLGICLVIVKRGGDPVIGTFLCVPLLLGAVWLRTIDFQLIAAIGSVAVLMTMYRFAWSRT